MYMVINLYFDPTISVSNLLKPLFSIPLFKPVGLVAIEHQNWFISGYDIGTAVYLYNNVRGTQNQVHVEAEPNDHDQLSYLKDMVEIILNDDQQIDLQISKFESAIFGQHLSHIDSVFSEATFEKAMDWITLHPMAGILMNGSIKLAFKYEGKSIDHWVYRPLYSNVVDWPFIEIEVRRRGQEHISASFVASSEVWLQNNSTTHLDIGNLEADANLNLFATLAKAILKPNLAYYKEGSLDIEGQPFMLEAPRIRAALSEIPSLD